MQPKEVEARTREYLPALMECWKWRRDARNVCEGDLVLVVDQNFPRGCWPLGRVLGGLPGNNGRVKDWYLHVTCHKTVLLEIAK